MKRRTPRRRSPSIEVPADATPADKAAEVHEAYAVIRLRRFLDFALEGAIPADYDDRGRQLAYRTAARLALGECSIEDARARMKQVDWAAFLAATERIAAVAGAVQRFAIRYSLPDFIAREILAEFGDEEAAAFAEASLRHPPYTLRVNTLRTTRDALMDAFGRMGVRVARTVVSTVGLHLESPADVFHMSEFKAGHFEVQDEASQIAAWITAPPPRGRVADVCAGAGGKTLALAALLGGHGRILATDTAPRRIEELRRRARRAGAHQIDATLISAGSWPEPMRDFLRSAHRILLDVPCSGLGTLRRRPEMRWTLTEDDLGRIESLQRELAERAARHLQPGARLVYATCTVRRRENEDVIDELRERHPDLEVVRLAEILGAGEAAAITDPSGSVLKLLPHRHGTDGFFAAVLRRKR